MTLRIEPKYGRVYQNATVLLRPKTGLKDMVAELEPGTPARRAACEDGDVIPVSQTLPDVNLDEILAVARRRHARLPDASCSPPAPRACAATGRDAGRRDPPLRADRALRPQGVRRARRAPAEHQARRSTTSRWSSTSSAPRTTSSPSSSRTRTPSSPRSRARTRTCARRCASCRPRSTTTQRGARQGATRWPTSSARRCRRCGPAPARSGRRCAACARSCARRRRSSATRSARSCAPRGRRSTQLRPALQRPRRRDARPHARRSRSSTRCSTRSPTTRRAQRGGLPVLGLVGQPPRQPGLRHAGRARPDPPRPRRRHLPGRRRCSTQVAQANPLLGMLTDLLDAADAGAARIDARTRRGRLS